MIKPLSIVPIPVPRGCEHPDAPFPQLPKHEFTMGIIAPKGAGKTTIICNLLQFYKKYFHRILVFSPTIDSDEKWDHIKTQKLLIRNVALEELLKKLRHRKKKKTNTVVMNPPEDDSSLAIVEEDNPFSPLIPEEDFFVNYSDDSLLDLMTKQKATIDLLKKHDHPKYMADRILIIFDDQVGSSLFRGIKGTYFTGLNTRHRHYSSSFIMVSQGYKEIPKTIRTGWTCLIVFEIGNEKEIEVIYEEFPMGLKWKDWLACYEHCVSIPYGFLFLNFQPKDKSKRIMCMFDKYLEFK